MKKLLAILLCLTMIVSFAACGKKAEEPQKPEETVTEPETPETPAEPEAPVEETPVEKPVEEPVEEPAETPETEEGDDAYAELLDKLAQLTEGATPEEMMLMNVEVPAENYEYTLFVPYIEGSKAVVSEPMIGSIAHSVALLQLPEDADAEAVAAEIEANMDPRKWICVEAEASWVKVSGQYVLMVMSSQEAADVIAANFDTVFGA